jgi:hypothetical protein
MKTFMIIIRFYKIEKPEIKFDFGLYYRYRLKNYSFSTALEITIFWISDVPS